MDNLNGKIKEYENRHKKYGNLYYRGITLKTNGIRGLVFWYDVEGFFRRAFHFFVRVFPLMVAVLLAMNTKDAPNIKTPLAIYAGIHIALGVTGAVMEKIGLKNLLLLKEEVNGVYNEYSQEKFAEYGISKGTIYFDNGVAVSSENVKIELGRDCGCINIFQLDKRNENTSYKETKENLPENNMELNSYIASVGFNNKYGVIIHKDTKVKSVAFLSPSVQMEMIRKSDSVSVFDNIRVRGSVLSADTGYKVETIPPINIFCIDVLLSYYFKDVDRYCEDLLYVGNRVLEDVSHINFVRENF